jgi:hypothetical protein
LWNGWAADHHAAPEIAPRKPTMTRTTQALPAEASGTEITRFNALRHGVLSRRARANDQRSRSDDRQCAHDNPS